MGIIYRNRINNNTLPTLTKFTQLALHARKIVMKGQVEPITLILISSVIVSLVGAAYFWGIPIIQKRSTIADFTSGTNFILALNDKIVAIANSGGGTGTITIPKGFVRAISHDDGGPNANSVIYEILVDQPMIVTGQEIPIKSSNTQEVGTFGENEPRVITVKQESSGTQYKLIFKLHYIELDVEGDSPKGFKIALSAPDTSAGGEEVIVSFGGSVVQAGQAENGWDLALTLVNVDVI